MRVKEILKLPPPGAVIENGRLQVNVGLPGLPVRYTTDGTKPTSASHRYRGPVSVDEGATVKLRTFDTLGRGGRPVILEVSSYTHRHRNVRLICRVERADADSVRIGKAATGEGSSSPRSAEVGTVLFRFRSQSHRPAMEDDLTIDQVAELAYVSRSVVSRVLNDHPNVSEEARQRVLKVIEEHDYRPSSVARSLATDRSFEISVLTPRRSDESMARGYWPLLFSGLFERCLERGYFVSLSMVSEEVEDEIQNRARDQRFDGYILITTEVIDLVASFLKESETPVTLVGRAPDWDSISSVDIDNEEGGYESGRHLCTLGYEEIGLILGNPALEESGSRRAGIERALSDAGRSVPDRYVAEGDYSRESGYSIVRNWAERGEMPRALLCASDTVATGALLALHETGYRVPDDVAVMGFDDLPAAQYTVPPLTTMRQPVYEKGQTAVDLLIDQIERPNAEPVHKELDPELVVRESCGAQ